MSAKWKIHPVAATYPPMNEVELEALAADIAERGLQRPVVRYKGEVLDGRNRLLACERAGVEPTFIDYEGDDPLGQANSLNLTRDLTAAQRAIVAAKQLPFHKEEAEKRQKAAGEHGKEGGRGKKKENPQPRSVAEGNGKASRVVAKILRAGINSVEQAAALLDDAPDLADRVASATMSLAAAYEELQERRKDAARKERDRERVAKHLEAISSGEMTMEDALEQVMAEEREEAQRRASQADARKTWLKELASFVGWVEEFVADLPEADCAWYTLPGSPGLFDHGLTACRVRAAAAALSRVAALTFGDTP